MAKNDPLASIEAVWWSTLYEGDGDEPPLLPPRVAYALHHKCLAVQEDMAVAVGDGDYQWVIDLLPPVARRYGQWRPWLDLWVERFGIIAGRLHRDTQLLTSCTGDELALDIALRDIDDMMKALSRNKFDRVYRLLPKSENDDNGSEWWLDVLFDDTDYAMLYNPMLDGIEDSESDINQLAGIGPFLHPEHWFDTFEGLVRPYEPEDD